MKKKAIIAAVLVLCLCLAGIWAKTIRTDQAVNEFTVGKVSVKLLQPGLVPAAISSAMPGAVFANDPQAQNTGNNEEYVFMAVTVPYENVKLEDADGTRHEKALTEMFKYEVNDGWTEVTAYQNEGVDKTYVYAYGEDELTALTKSDVTTPLFDEVQLVDFALEDDMDNAVEDLSVNCFAIQTQNLAESGNTYNGDNEDGIDGIKAIWNIIYNQRLIDFGTEIK